MFFDDGSPTFPTRQKIESDLQHGGFVLERVSYAVVLPFAFCHRLNRILERTPLRRFSLFVVFVARKVAR
jgi:hypothetical protein